jgi:protein involved in sex pheromone biosynthesis
MLRRVGAAAVAAAILLAAAPAARADDDEVKQVVAAQEKKIAPDNKAFAKVAKNLTESKVGKAKRLTTKLLSDITAYRTALLRTEASSTDVAKGRTALLSALRKQRAGFKSFRNALTKYTSGKSEASVKKSLNAAIKKLKSGQKDAAKAAKLLGLTGTET